MVLIYEYNKFLKLCRFLLISAKWPTQSPISTQFHCSFKICWTLLLGPERLLYNNIIQLSQIPKAPIPPRLPVWGIASTAIRSFYQVAMFPAHCTVHGCSRCHEVCIASAGSGSVARRANHAVCGTWVSSSVRRSRGRGIHRHTISR